MESIVDDIITYVQPKHKHKQTEFNKHCPGANYILQSNTIIIFYYRDYNVKCGNYFLPAAVCQQLQNIILPLNKNSTEELIMQQTNDNIYNFSYQIVDKVIGSVVFRTQPTIINNNGVYNILIKFLTNPVLIINTGNGIRFNSLCFKEICIMDEHSRYFLILDNHKLKFDYYMCNKKRL